jgi:hypothetical protein
MRRLHWAIEAFQRDRTMQGSLDEKLADYNGLLYEWNDRLNGNLALLGSYFGEAAREYLYGLYEHFRRAGAELEEALAVVRRDDDARALLEGLDSEFEGWQAGSLNSRVYLLSLTLMTQLREGAVGRSALDRLPTPILRT